MTVTRRQVLQTGAFAGLAGILPEPRSCVRRQSPGDVLPPGTALWAGDATQETVRITSYTGDLPAGTELRLRVVAADGTAKAAQPARGSDSSHFTRWSVDGLAADTAYRYQLRLLDGTRYGPTYTFRTLRPIGQPCTITIAVGGCKPEGAHAHAFRDIVKWAPDRVMNLGDMGYPQGLTTDPATHKLNWARQVVDPSLQLIQARGCVDYIASDHDTTGNLNNPPDLGNPISAANLLAWAEMVPARMDDTRHIPLARYRSEVEGHVRFVKLDTRNQERSNVLDGRRPDDPTSTMLGAHQLRWLERQIDAAAQGGEFLCLFTDPGWYGVAARKGGRIMRSNSDKWIAYLHERDYITRYLNDAYAAQGKSLNAMVVSSDTHALQQDDGRHRYYPLASVVCGPFDNHVHALDAFQHAYQWTYPASFEGEPHMQMYQRLTFAEADGALTVTAQAMDCTSGTGVVQRTMTKVFQL
jgi:phosphodiesterase/alkaline phosphatase D-like protein